jgi:hypothetical protein
MDRGCEGYGKMRESNKKVQIAMTMSRDVRKREKEDESLPKVVVAAAWLG